MRLLIDTHTLIWTVDDPAKLGSEAALALQDPANELLLSAGSVWELAIKVGLGKLSLSLPYRQWVSLAIAELAASVVPVTVEYADVQSRLPLHHRDPFDRLLVAQSRVENVPLVSADEIFDRYGIARLW